MEPQPAFHWHGYTFDLPDGAIHLARSEKCANQALRYGPNAYGLHCEDLDLMFRLQQAGHDCLFVPQARAVHQQGVSSRSRPLWVHWQKHRGMQRFFRKFQASDRSLPVRGLVLAGIWARFALTAPLAILRR